VKILASIKPVPNPDEKVKIKTDGSGIVLENIKVIVNPFCEIAVEEGLRIREKLGGEVVVVTVGGQESEQQLRAALAMGADRAILVKAEMDLDSLAVGKLLSKVVGTEKPDLVLLGKQSVDDDNTQVGQILSAILGWPQATFASKIELSADLRKAQVTREVDGGLETIEVTLPTVVTADLRLNEPRYASLPGIMKAKKKEVKVVAAASLDVDVTPRVKILSYATPKQRTGGGRVADVLELVSKLRNEAKVI
jgi:electron transfer flavoprotein beta subunit